MAVATKPQQQQQEPVTVWPALVAVLRRLVAESAVASVTLGGAFLVGSLLIIGTSVNPWNIIARHGLTIQTLGLILHYPFNAYVSLFSGAFGNPDLGTTSVTIGQAVPLVFTGLAVAFAFRAGLFNIGAEGQLYMGALAATWVGITFASLPAVILLPFLLLSSILAGMVWGGISGFLKAYRGAHEVITTIMLNYTAIYLTSALVEVQGPLNSPKAQGQAVSGHIGDGGFLPLLTWLGKNSSIDAGAYLAIIAVALFWFVVWRTSLGYEIRAVGLNAGAAAYGGIPVQRRIVLAMAIAGGLGGLAGGVHIADPSSSGTFQSAFSPGWGFDGIAVALLGKGNPIGIILSAILFGALRTGSQNMQVAGVSPHMTELLQGIIILFVALDALARKLLGRRRARMAADDASGALAATPTSPVTTTDAGATIDATTLAGRTDTARYRRKGDGAAWRGLLILAVVSATCALLFAHVPLGIAAIVLAALFIAIRGGITRGTVGIIVYSVICLALGLAVNRYL